MSNKRPDGNVLRFVAALVFFIQNISTYEVFVLKSASCNLHGTNAHLNNESNIRASNVHGGATLSANLIFLEFSLPESGIRLDYRLRG